MFAFVMTAGSYLGLVRSASHVHGVQRRAIDAAVAGCASVPIAVGFRGWLWWIANSSEATAGPLQLTRLLFIVGVATVVLVFGGESLARIHGTPVDDG
jgi:hypothetical protein